MSWTKEIFFSSDIIEDYNPNTVYTWIGSDTKENFNKHAINGAVRGYTETSINYHLNEYGFRSIPFQIDLNKFRILAVGCSHTFGIGNKFEDIWPNKLSSNIENSVVYNLGLSGQSCDYVVRAVYKTIEFFKPNLVAVEWPPLGRFEVPLVTKTAMYVHPMDKDYPIIMGDQKFINYNYEKNLSFLAQICSANNALLVHITDEHAWGDYVDRDYGRDGHFGPKTHAKVANELLKQYLLLA